MAKNWAICIGINHYDYNRPLECAVNDATAMSEFFRKVKFDKVYLFTDNSPPIEDMSRDFPSQPTYTKVRTWLRKRFKKTNNPPLDLSDNLWFFFSGHGWRHRGQDYLLLSDSDSDAEYIEGTALTISEITFHLRQSGAGNIIMLLDACRDSAKGGSIELAKEQGIIKISSCQPNQLSYEIKALGHGAFTFALLEALNRQGEGNCATLERLCNCLRNQVPKITQQYHHKTQIPYAAVEPETKYHLILLPDYILPSLQDLSRLREEALKAEIEGDLKLAEIIWTRLLKFDTEEALASLYRIRDKLKEQPSPATIVEEISPTVSNSKSVAQPNLNLPQISLLHLPIPKINRRQLLKGLGWGGAGIGIITVAKIVQKLLFSSPPFPSVKTEIKGKESYQFQVVTVNRKGEEIKRETKEAKYFSEHLGNGVTLDMVSIPAGKFIMGTDDTEIERLVKKLNWDGFKRESPQHSVTVQPFFMGKFLITQAQWKAIASRKDLKIKRDLKVNPSYFQGDDNLPVERINWYDAVEFCARLTKITGKNYRLPSEAQWEYACRAVISDQLSLNSELTVEEWNQKYHQSFHFGETITSDLANYNANYTFADESKGKYREKTTAVGTFPLNSFGLYDMHGNLWEWCADPLHDDYNNAPDDGSVWDEEAKDDRYSNYLNAIDILFKASDFRVLRGGSWSFTPGYCRSAYRDYDNPDIHLNRLGFRVVCG